MESDIGSYAIALLLTLVLEIAVAWLLGYRSRVEIAAIFWVNVFSHPLVNYLVWIVGVFRSHPVALGGILLFEAGVVLVEWRLLAYSLPRLSRTRLLVLSVVMNGLSYSFPSLLAATGATA